MGRILRFNEAKRQNDKVVMSDLSRLDKMKEDWIKIEDDQPWDFQYFWGKIEKYLNDFSNRYQPESRSLNFDIFPESRDGGNQTELSDVDWRRRNGIMRIEVCTGGYSGGSCWDDHDNGNYARRYETGDSLDMEDFLKFIEHILEYIFGKNHPFFNMSELLEKLRASHIIKEDSYTNYEYYGNSDDYTYYSIRLWDLYVFLAKNNIF